jgi:nucleoside-diphosphate-sugar epimerase
MVNYIGVKSVCTSIFDAFTFSKNSYVFNINAPYSILDFSNILVDSTKAEIKTIRTIPSIFKFAFKIACKIGDFLPTKYQKINSSKYRELTDSRYIDSNLFFKQTDRNPSLELKEELTELAHWYQNKNML